MAGHVLKRRRLVNPGRRRRMTAKQIRFFGTKRQKAALRNRRRNVSIRKTKKTSSWTAGLGRRLRTKGRIRRIHRAALAGRFKRGKTGRRPTMRRRNQFGIISQAEHAAASAIRDVERAAEDAIESVTGAVKNRGRRRRRRNIGEILTVVPANPGRRRRRKGMAAVRRRRNRRRVYNRGRRRLNYRRRNRRGLFNRRRHRNRSRMSNPRVIVRYRNRRHRRRNFGRRRNQGVLTGNVGAVVGVLGGAAVTKIVTGFLPSTLTTGWAGYLTTGLTAVVVGNVTGRMTRNRSLGNWMTVGGLLIVGLQIAGNLFPQLQLPFTTSGTSGMGLITSSNFFVPQVNQPGSMATFVTPAGIPQPVVVPASGMRGLGAQPLVGLRSIRRMGRMR